MSYPIRVFLSHNNSNQNGIAGNFLKEKLRAANYDVFIDDELKGGDNWRQRILKNLANTDVLIVLIDKETAESDWVQREVDIARGAQISILPVLVDTNYDDIKGAIERLNIEEIQYMEFDATDFSKIINRIDPLSEQTYTQKSAAYGQWRTRTKKEPNNTLNPKKMSFKLPGLSDVTFHIATGDATECSGYDVLVNTENTYMQMARYYESNTLSCQIRTKGAKRPGKGQKIGRIEEDTVQIAIYDQVRHSEYYAHLPLMKKQLVVTLPGHPESYLSYSRHLDFRYIFHVASVDLDESSQKIAPLPASANPDLIQNCYNWIMRVNDERGNIIYTPDGERQPPATEYTPLESILFPVFGTGQGNSPFNEYVKTIIEGFKQHTKNYVDQGMSVKEIGLSIFDADNVPMVEDDFIQAGFKKITS